MGEKIDGECFSWASKQENVESRGRWGQDRQTRACGTAVIWEGFGRLEPLERGTYSSRSVLRRCPERSFSESTGFPSRGHWMDTSGSLQSKVLSLSGL